jgi:protein-tyrosine phosphatase
MAEGLLRHMLAREGEARGSKRPSIEVSSAGTAGLEGWPASPEAVEVCREVGVEIGAHRSRALGPRLLAESDLVLTMEPHHEEMARLVRPDVADRIMTLGQYAGESEPRGVADPLGGDLACYRETLGEIQRLLSRALPRLVARAGGKQEQ